MLQDIKSWRQTLPFHGEDDASFQEDHDIPALDRLYTCRLLFQLLVSSQMIKDFVNRVYFD